MLRPTALLAPPPSRACARGVALIGQGRAGGGARGVVGAAVCGRAAAGVMAELSEEALLSVLPTIRVPKAGDRVHKDECAFSFDTPVSPFPTPAASTTSFHLPGHSAGACKAWATASMWCIMVLVVSHDPLCRYLPSGEACSATTIPGNRRTRRACRLVPGALWAL